MLIIVGRGRPPFYDNFLQNPALASRHAMRDFFQADGAPVAELSHQFDALLVSSRGSEPLIASQQRGVERFSQRNTDSIISCQVIQQIPNQR